MTKFQNVVLPRAADVLQVYTLGRRTKSEDEGIWTATVGPGIPLHAFDKVTDLFPWSLTAALTPGNHHVRLYIETEGQIDTIVSKKDNFTDFYDSDVGPLVFLDLSTSRPLDLSVRDPNVTVNDLGVYAMTWDNRPADIGPGHKYDSITVSPSFGLAFSVDGLNWTVYSNELTIEGLSGGLPSDSIYCDRYHTGKVRHVVPVFLDDEHIRLYFTYQVSAFGRTTCSGLSCSTGTAISN